MKEIILALIETIVLFLIAVIIILSIYAITIIFPDPIIGSSIFIGILFLGVFILILKFNS